MSTLSEKVVPIFKKQVEEKIKEQPYLEGLCKCLACGNQWQAVAPLGNHRVPCLRCGLNRGVWVNPIEPNAHTVQCGNCLGRLWYVSPGAWISCASCGQNVQQGQALLEGDPGFTGMVTVIARVGNEPQE